MSDELRRIRDTLIEELRRSTTLTVAGRALFARYAAMSEAATGTTAPADPQQANRARPRRAEDEEDFGGSFMVRNSPPQQPATHGYRETEPESPLPVELPRSMRERRR